MTEGTKSETSTAGIHPAEVVLPNKEVYRWMHLYRLSCSTTDEKDEARRELMKLIEKDEMLALYKILCVEFGWIEDENLVQTLAEANKKELEELEAAIDDAKVNFGDVELKDCLLAKANYFCRIHELDKAIEAYKIAQDKCVGVGGKLNITLLFVRLGILADKGDLTKEYLERAKKECQKGGDWEKRNKLKVYEGLHCCQQGRFAEAAQLCFSCVPIFTASEIISFEEFVCITIILTMATFDRPALKNEVITSPDILPVLHDKPLYRELLHNFFYRRYRIFMVALVKVYNKLCQNPYLMKHANYLFRLIRLRAYQQYMDPFDSLLMKTMADSFGLPQDMLERDIVEFVSNGKLNCQINRINGVIECTRQVAIDDHYIKSIKEGDLVLEKLQNLSKIINT